MTNLSALPGASYCLWCYEEDCPSHPLPTLPESFADVSTSMWTFSSFMKIRMLDSFCFLANHRDLYSNDFWRELVFWFFSISEMLCYVSGTWCE